MSSSHIEQLDNLLKSPGANSRPELKTALLRVSAEIRERIRQGAPSSAQFFSDALKTLSKMRGGAYAAVRMSCIFDTGFFLVTHGHGEQAMDAVSALEDLARRNGNRQWIRKAHSLSGIVNAELGNVAAAVISYSKALEVARETNDLPGQISVVLNLGVALNYGGLYREAIPCFAKVVAMTRTDAALKECPDSGYSAQEYECAALTNLAQSHLYLEQYKDGFDAILDCLNKAADPADARAEQSRAIREFTCVQLAIQLGKLETARKHALECARHGQNHGPRTNLLAQIAYGLCEVYGGNVSKGLSILEAALRSSHEPDSTRVDVLVALVQAYDEAGRPEDALAHLHELLGTMRHRHEKGLLALLSTPIPRMPDEKIIVSESNGLRALEYKEAQLRAKVAEREAVNARIEMLERLAVAADLKEEASGEHGFRVGKLASILAQELKWPKDACHAIELAARLHDIGKIGVPERILMSSAELKEAERHFISIHTIIGAELLAKSDVPHLRMAEEIARYHHEWWNGAGYPARIAGSRIPIHARIVALADVFDALTHGRPFAKAWPTEEALQAIRDRRGTQFDPELTDCFLAVMERLKTEQSDLDAYLGRASLDSPFLQARNRIRLMLAEERAQERVATVAGNDTRH